MAKAPKTHEGSTLEHVRNIMSKAVDAYYSLWTEGKWHVKNKALGQKHNVYWNCEKKGCSNEKHTQSKHQKKIAANIKKSLKQKKNGRKAKCGNKSQVMVTQAPTAKANRVLPRGVWITSSLERAHVLEWKKDCRNTIHITNFHNFHEKPFLSST